MSVEINLKQDLVPVDSRARKVSIGEISYISVNMKLGVGFKKKKKKSWYYRV